MIKLRPSIEICRQGLGDDVVGAEIGVLGGGHACTMLSNYPQLSRLHLVDSYGGITDQVEKVIEFRKRFDSEKHRLTWHIKTSIEAAATFADESLDFVYIDANHRYIDCSCDLRAWWRKVRPDGILCGHDYFTFGSVKKAVTDWAETNNHYVFSTDPDWWVFKE